MQLDLFRIKVFPRDKQGSLFDDGRSPQQAIKNAIEDQATSRRYRGAQWHIGNVEPVGEQGLYFRLGRGSRAMLSQIDEETGNFTEAVFENAPYTHCLIETPLELCMVARNSRLAPSTESIAKRLQAVLNQSATAERLGARFVVGVISNPDQFLSLLAEAYSIQSFTFWVQRRNPIDADEDFVQPFERLVGAANAFSGRATVKGHDLASAPLERIARSAAATGDDARAKLKIEEDSPPVVKTLQGDSASISVEALDSLEERVNAILKAKNEYRRIRGSDTPQP